MKEKLSLLIKPITLVFATIFFIPSTIVLLYQTPDYYQGNIVPAVVVVLFASMVLAVIFNLLYQTTKNRLLKAILIIAAVILSLGAAALIFLLLEVMYRPRICDPVHTPPDDTIPGTVTTTISNTTASTDQICDPVHRPIIEAIDLGNVLGNANVPQDALQKYLELAEKILR